MRRRFFMWTLFVMLGLVSRAAAYDYTWVGWNGPVESNPAWGGYWTWDYQTFLNGWGESWAYWQDPAAHFPSISSTVLIPAGASVDTDGGGQPYCGSLTGSGYLQGQVAVGASAVVNSGGESEAGSLNIWGPATFADGATLVSEWSQTAEDLLRVNGLFTATGADTVRVEFLDEGPATPTDYAVLRADSHDDQSTWVLQLPAGCTSAGLEWVGNDLVVRSLGAATSVAEGVAPAPTVLRAAPNPFNPSTTIRYTNSEAGPVRLWVSDLQGRRVRTLLSGFQRSGAFDVAWDGRSDAGRPVGSGAYFCVLETRERRHSIRLTIIR